MGQEKQYGVEEFVGPFPCIPMAETLSPKSPEGEFCQGQSPVNPKHLQLPEMQWVLRTG